jgi:serine/threonine-protein kinase
MQHKELQNYIQSLPGTSLGKCKISEFYRDDAMLLIFKGRHTELSKEVAIKILLPLPSVDYFMARYKKVMALSHPNIIKIYDIGFSGELEKHYIIEEWDDGNSLADIVSEEGTQALEDTLKILLDVMQGLSYAHSQGVVHGNLIPSNIIYHGSQSARITNFGLVPIHEIKGKFAAKPVMGTLGYLPPEMLHGELPNASGDIYTLGCSFATLLLGTIPFPSQKDFKLGSNAPYTPPALQFSAEMPEPVVCFFKGILDI